MLTEKEKSFLQYWEKNRDSESGFSSKLVRGLPMALLFALPVLLLVMSVWIYFPDWYMKISNTSPGAFIAAIIALLLVVIFYAYFRMQFKWESNEQLYNELKAKEKKLKTNHN